MTRGKIVLVTVLAGVFGLGLSIFAQHRLDREKDRPLSFRLGRDSATDDLERVPEFRLPNTTGEVIDSSSWAGKVLVLNFWATWCPPCLRELPQLDEVKRSHSEDELQIVGIAVDKKDDVERFLTEHPVSFPILLGDLDAIEMSRRLGNRLQGLPFTAIFDHRGNRVYGQAGEMTHTSLSELLNSLIAERRKPGRPGAGG
jgi:peroxiredoxin